MSFCHSTFSKTLGKPCITSHHYTQKHWNEPLASQSHDAVYSIHPRAQAALGIKIQGESSPPTPPLHCCCKVSTKFLLSAYCDANLASCSPLLAMVHIYKVIKLYLNTDHKLLLEFFNFGIAIHLIQS